MRARPRNPRVRQRFDPEAVARGQNVHLAIEMAAAGNPRPQWFEPILPARDAGFRSASVLDEEQSAALLQHAAENQGQSRFVARSATRRT